MGFHVGLYLGFVASCECAFDYDCMLINLWCSCFGLVFALSVCYTFGWRVDSGVVLWILLMLSVCSRWVVLGYARLQCYYCNIVIFVS